MKIAFSNIAWLPEEDEAAYALLREEGIGLVEAAPARFWPDPAAVDDANVDNILRILAPHGLELCGFQAILFQKAELLLFDEVARPRLLAYLKHLALLCARNKGGYLVFGAPKNRWIPEGYRAEEAWDRAVDFFRELGREAARQGVCFGMEANPSSYGCNFCTHVEEVVRLVRQVDSPGFRWHLDTGELVMNREQLPGVVLDHDDLVGSVHISEANLGGFAHPWEGHEAVAGCLRQMGYAGAISIEMKRPPTGLDGVLQAVREVRRLYQV